MCPCVNGQAHGILGDRGRSPALLPAPCSSEEPGTPRVPWLEQQDCPPDPISCGPHGPLLPSPRSCGWQACGVGSTLGEGLVGLPGSAPPCRPVCQQATDCYTGDQPPVGVPSPRDSGLLDPGPRGHWLNPGRQQAAHHGGCNRRVYGRLVGGASTWG